MFYLTSISTVKNAVRICNTLFVLVNTLSVFITFDLAHNATAIRFGTSEIGTVKRIQNDVHKTIAPIRFTK